MPAKAKLTTRERTTSNVAADNLNKGSELSFAEADSNFFNLRDQTFAISDGSTTTDIEAGETITFSGASVSGNTVTIDGSGVGGASTGDITFIGSTMLGPSNADITIQPSGTGDIHLFTDSASHVKIGESTANNYWTFLSGNILRYYSSSSTSSIIDNSQGGQIQMDGAPQNGDIRLQTLTGGEIIVGPQNLDARITTDGTASLIINTNSGTNSGSVVINEGVNGNINITPNGTGQIVLDGLNWPTSDGTAGEFLKTDGSGNLSFDTPAISSFGDLTASGSTITAPTNQTMVLDVSGSGLIQLNNMEINDTTITTVFPNENVRLETKGTGLIDYDSITHRFGTGSGDANITTNNTFDIIIDTNQGTNSGFIKINQGSSGAIELSPSPSGKVVIDGIDWPTADGTNGQVLQTNGSGVLTFGDGTGGQHTITSPTATTSTLTADRSDGLVQFCDVNSLVTNLAIAQPSNMSAGDQLILVLKGNRLGSHNLSWNGIYNAYGTGSFGLTNGNIQVLRIVYDGTNYTSVTSGNLTAGN